MKAGPGVLVGFNMKGLTVVVAGVVEGVEVEDVEAALGCGATEPGAPGRTGSADEEEGSAARYGSVGEGAAEDVRAAGKREGAEKGKKKRRPPRGGADPGGSGVDVAAGGGGSGGVHGSSRDQAEESARDRRVGDRVAGGVHVSEEAWDRELLDYWGVAPMVVGEFLGGSQASITTFGCARAEELKKSRLWLTLLSDESSGLPVLAEIHCVGLRYARLPQQIVLFSRTRGWDRKLSTSAISFTEPERDVVDPDDAVSDMEFTARHMQAASAVAALCSGGSGARQREPIDRHTLGVAHLFPEGSNRRGSQYHRSFAASLLVRLVLALATALRYVAEGWLLLTDLHVGGHPITRYSATCKHLSCSERIVV